MPAYVPAHRPQHDLTAEVTSLEVVHVPAPPPAIVDSSPFRLRFATEPLLRDRHPAYLGWAEFELNLRQLADNRSPVRGKGSGLLSGLLRCGRCRQRMTIHYRDSGESAPYSCRGERDYGGAACQSLSAGRLDGFVSQTMVSVLSPLSTELSLDAVANAEADRACLHEQWRLRLARAEQKAEAARRAYGKVDPGNRLVAQTLETAYATIKGFEVMRALRKGQAAMFSIQGGIIGEARIVERAFGVGPCVVTEAMAWLQDHLASADA